MSSPSSPKRPRLEESEAERPAAVDHSEEEDPGFIDRDPDAIEYLEDQEVVDELVLVQSKLEKVNDEASDRVLAVEQEFNQLRRPIFEERGQLIRQIPGFWLNCFLQHRELARLITERVAEVLAFVTDLDIQDYPDIKSGYTLSLEFADNPYIEDTRVVKEFNFTEDGRCSITAVQLQWKGKDLVEEEIERGEGGGYGFMCWLTEARELELGETDQYADIIKDQLWPNPMQFLTGEGDGEQDRPYDDFFNDEVIQLGDSDDEEEYEEEGEYDEQEEEEEGADDEQEEGAGDEQGEEEEGADVEQEEEEFEEGAEEEGQPQAAEEAAD